MRRAEALWRSPLLVPILLAGVYLVLLIIRFPQLIGWENGDSDIASAYVLTDAISHGHTGHVVMSTQGSWVPLWYGLLTQGLGFHRVLWATSPALLTLAAALLIGWSLPRLRFTSTFIPLHIRWLVQGLLRLGNGLSVAPHPGVRTPLVVAAGIATGGALAAVLWFAGRGVIRPAAGAAGRARDAHVLFWTSSLLCPAAA